MLRSRCNATDADLKELAAFFAALSDHVAPPSVKAEEHRREAAFKDYAETKTTRAILGLADDWSLPSWCSTLKGSK